MCEMAASGKDREWGRGGLATCVCNSNEDGPPQLFLLCCDYAAKRPIFSPGGPSPPDVAQMARGEVHPGRVRRPLLRFTPTHALVLTADRTRSWRCVAEAGTHDSGQRSSAAAPCSRRQRSVGQLLCVLCLFSAQRSAPKNAVGGGRAV